MKNQTGKLGRKIKNAATYAAGGTVGAGVGFGSWLYSNAQAHAIVELWPEIANIDFITAVLADKSTEWLTYRAFEAYPTATAAAFTISGAAIGLAIAYYANKFD